MKPQQKKGPAESKSTGPRGEGPNAGNVIRSTPRGKAAHASASGRRDSARQDADNALLAAVRAHPEGVEVRALVVELGRGYAPIVAALRRLELAGAVKRALDPDSLLDRNTSRIRWLATAAAGLVRTIALEKGIGFGRRRRPVVDESRAPELPAGVVAGERLVVLPVAELASPTDRFRCSYLSASLAASACVARADQGIRPCCVCPATGETTKGPLLAEVRARLAVLAKKGASSS